MNGFHYRPSTEHKLLNELTQPEHFPPVRPKECIESKSFRYGGTDISAIICIKPLETDIWVSGTIKKTGAWETETISNVIHILSRFRNAIFVGSKLN